MSEKESGHEGQEPERPEPPRRNAFQDFISRLEPVDENDPEAMLRAKEQWDLQAVRNLGRALEGMEDSPEKDKLLLFYEVVSRHTKGSDSQN